MAGETFLLCAAKDISTWLQQRDYLRGMTYAFQQGQLNLMGNLIGLSERKRQD